MIHIKKIFFSNLILIILLLFTAILYLFTLEQVGICIDGYPSIEAGQRYVQWFGYIGNYLLGNGQASPLSKSIIDNYWRINCEHPPLAKLIYGLSGKLSGWLLPPLASFRLGGLMIMLMLIAFMYKFMESETSTLAALTAGLYLLLSPRIFGHAHFCALDVPAAICHTVAVITFYWGLKKPMWSYVAGLFLGLGMLAKLNGLFVPIYLIIWGQILYRRDYRHNLNGALFVAPSVFFAGWPWLWHETIDRLFEYFQFFLKHDYHPTYYFGQVYTFPPAPWHYPFVTFAITTPTVFLLIGLWGIYSGFLDINKRTLHSLMLLNFLAPIVLLIISPSPKYDGNRMYFASVLIFAYFCGTGFEDLRKRLEKTNFLNRLPGNLRPRWHWITLGMIGIWMFFVLFSYFPYCTSYYNILIGGLRGSFKAGMETVFWGEALNLEVVRDINRTFPVNATVDYNTEAYTTLQGYLALGYLRRDFQYVDGGKYWILSTQQAYSNMAGWWELYHDRHPHYKQIRSYKLKGIKMLNIWERR